MINFDDHLVNFIKPSEKLALKVQKPRTIEAKMYNSR